MNAKSSLVIFAPGIHTGGGATLLKALADTWPEDRPCTAFLDRRVEGVLDCPASWTVSWCRRTLGGTFAAELELARLSTPDTAIFCFSSLPPIFARARDVTVYVHNPYLVGLGPRVRGRLAARVLSERAVFRLGMRRVSKFWVQTKSMARAVQTTVEAAVGKCAPVQIMPFWDEPIVPRRSSTPSYDFVYVADGVPHKNHLRLFEAWAHLAAEGHFPSLAITLGTRDSGVAAVAEAASRSLGTKIVNLGHIPRERVMELYARSGALMFPSKAETFGLPLIEAARAGLPIVASERDFVRDVCIPTQTFDPDSAISIKSAVKRQMGWDHSPPAPMPAAQLADEIWWLSKSRDVEAA